MAIKWSAIGVIPNLDVKTECFGGDFLAVVGAADPRFGDALANGPNLRQFLSQFSGAHGQQVRPSLLVKSDAYPGKPATEAISSFMDIVIATVILDSRVRTVTWERNVGPMYSESFDIYPWMIAPDGDRLRSQNAAMWQIHELKSFRGTASPIVPVQDVGTEHAHTRMFSQLHALWQSRFIAMSDDWEPRAVLRSLNMVTSASRLSASTVFP